MPLTRTPSGDLGVKATNAPAQETEVVNLGGIHISTRDADSFNDSKDQVMSVVMSAMAQARRNM